MNAERKSGSVNEVTTLAIPRERSSDAPVVEVIPADQTGWAASMAERLEQPRLPPDRLQSGMVLEGKYRLDEVVGRGGMGVVFRGTRLDFHTAIAVKVMHPFVAAHPSHARRFRAEARASLLLNHPHAVQVLDFGEHEGAPFIVMEYIHGVSLDAWLEALPTLPRLTEVGTILSQLLSALSSAHDLGIVHRDLKPENILLRQETDGRLWIKVVDFGLAHVEDPDSPGKLTVTDTIAGTPKYMSPEQCRSMAVSPSADLYATGCILTTLLQGEPPFTGESAAVTMSKHMYHPAPPIRRLPSLEPIPPLLERLRLDLLEKSPAARPGSASEARARLEMALEPSSSDIPARKSANPSGDRRDRGSWNASPGPSMDREAHHVALMTIAVAPGGLGDSCRIGLASQGLLVHGFDGTALPTEKPCEVVVIDGACESALTLSALLSLRGNHPQLPILVCLQDVTPAVMNALIEAGASDVQAYPLEPDKVSRKLLRLARRKR